MAIQLPIETKNSNQKSADYASAYANCVLSRRRINLAKSLIYKTIQATYVFLIIFAKVLFLVRNIDLTVSQMCVVYLTDDGASCRLSTS